MSNLEIEFERLAYTTWDTILNAHLQGIAYGEDAITSINLLSLKNSGIKEIEIFDTRSTESTKGCDFEFWIGNNTDGWARYVIQAKKISVPKSRYNSLGHKVSGIPQIDILRKYATAINAIPVYCFFNTQKFSTTVSPNCFKFKNIKELGCSVTSLANAELALKTHGARNFSFIHSRKESVPWACLARCVNARQRLSRSKGEGIYKSLPFKTSQLETANFIEPHLGLYNEAWGETPLRPNWLGIVNTPPKGS